VSNFCFFWENDLLWSNFQNSVPKVNIATPIGVVVFKCRKICPTEISEIVRYSNDKISAPSQTVAIAQIVPKICQGQPSTCSRFHPNQLKWYRFRRRSAVIGGGAMLHAAVWSRMFFCHVFFSVTFECRVGANDFCNKALEYRNDFGIYW